MQAKKGDINIAVIVIVTLIFVGAGIGCVLHLNHVRQVKRDERQRAEVARIEREKAELARETERRRIQERERERERLEREKREEEREQSRLAEKKRAAELAAEKVREMNEREARRKEYFSARELFAEQEAMIWEDVSQKNRPKVTEKRIPYWCVFASHEVDKLFYKVDFTDSGKISVRAFDGERPPQDVNPDEFADRCSRQKHAIVVAGQVWVRGVPASGSEYGMPDESRDFLPALSELKSFYDVLSGFGVTFDNVKVRVSMKARKGAQTIPLGVVAYDDPIDQEKIDGALEGVLLAKKKKGGLRYVKPSGPKLKKFKRTVVFYDGDLIKKDMRGVTHIPRTFVFHGTKYHSSRGYRSESDARQKWESLCDEAKRQEQEEAAVEIENQRLQEEYEQKLSELERKKQHAEKVGLRDVDKERANWSIIVERIGVETRK